MDPRKADGYALYLRAIRTPDAWSLSHQFQDGTTTLLTKNGGMNFAQSKNIQQLWRKMLQRPIYVSPE
jgi:hypothetical protein